MGLVFYGIYLWIDSDEETPVWETIVVLTAPGAALSNYESVKFIPRG